MKKRKKNIFKVIGELFFFMAHVVLLFFPIFQKRLTPNLAKLMSWTACFLFTAATLADLVSHLISNPKKKDTKKDDDSTDKKKLERLMNDTQK